MPKQNTPPADHPQAVLQQIAGLARNIVIARKRRGETQAQWAARLGVSLPTMARIERGDPSVAMASYVMCLWLINQAEGLADLASPLHDRGAMEREVARTQQGASRPALQAAVRPSGRRAAAAEAGPAGPAPGHATAAGLAALLGHPVGSA